jgi:hypothetical protein
LSQHLRKVGNEFLIGGLVMGAVSLAIIVYDRAVYGGTDVVFATCVLFLGLGGLLAVIGLVIRAVARARSRSQRSPFSPDWRPPPVTRTRSRR